jgi:hypothetical protein
MFELTATRVAPCTYILDQHVLPNNCIVTGELQIEVCRWADDELFIDSMTLDIEDEDGNVIGKWYGSCDKSATLQKIADMIETDPKMMGFIFDAAAVAAEDNAAY